MAEPAAKRTKDMMLRLDPDLAEQLRAVAQVEGRTMSDVAREAIAELVEARWRDRAFIRRLDESLAKHRQTLELLRGDDR